MAVDKLVHSILYTRPFSMGVMFIYCFMTSVATILKESFQAWNPDFQLVGQVSNMLLLKVGQTTHKVKKKHTVFLKLLA